MSLVVECQPAPRQRLPGYLVRGWLLRLLGQDAAPLVDVLRGPVSALPGEAPEAFEARRRRPRPFTVSPIFAGGWFRVTSMWDGLSRWLLSLSAESCGEVVVPGYRAAVVRVASHAGTHPLALTATPEQLAGWAMTEPDLAASVRLSFESPTLFSGPRATGNTVLPEPHLVFESLADAWSAYSGLPLEPARVKEVTGAARMLAFDVREDRMAGPNHEDPSRGRTHWDERGFVGWAEFGLGTSAPPESVRLLHLLAAFSRFSGVGARTTHGFGQAIPFVAAAVPRSVHQRSR